jgi:acetyl-CoA carboxylase carboxyltransferase component
VDPVVEVDLDHVRPDLAELLARRALLTDAGRPEVVAGRHERGRWTAREAIGALCDPGSFTSPPSAAGATSTS